MHSKELSTCLTLSPAYQGRSNTAAVSVHTLGCEVLGGLTLRVQKIPLERPAQQDAIRMIWSLRKKGSYLFHWMRLDQTKRRGHRSDQRLDHHDIALVCLKLCQRRKHTGYMHSINSSRDSQCKLGARAMYPSERRLWAQQTNSNCCISHPSCAHIPCMFLLSTTALVWRIQTLCWAFSVY